MFPQPSGTFPPQWADRTDSSCDMPMLASACSIRSGSGAFLSEGELVSGEEPGIEVVEAPAIRVTESMPGLRFSVSQAKCCQS
jgi:hypothetical protein